MGKESVVHVVARSLAKHMEERGLSAKSLGKKAGLSPRTVGNFLKPAYRQASASGKQPSGKLTELEMIAQALGVSFVDLVTDNGAEIAEQRRRLQDALAILSGTPASPPPDKQLDKAA